MAIELVVKEDFQEKLARLGEYAGSKTDELKSPVLRLLQIEALLAAHLGRRSRRASRSASKATLPEE